MDKKIPKIKREKVPEKDNDVSNSSSISITGPTIPQRPYKLGILGSCQLKKEFLLSK